MSEQKNVRRAARLYHDWDANVVAIKSSGSSPYKNTVGRWKHLHEGRQSADDLHRAGFDHRDLSGVGIVHGPGDYRHFDIDGCSSFTVVERILNALGVNSKIGELENSSVCGHFGTIKKNLIKN